MPSEPLEAEFAQPPALSRAQEDDLRKLEREGPLDVSVAPSLSETVDVTYDVNAPPDLDRLATRRTQQGYHIVDFDKVKCEDPR